MYFINFFLTDLVLITEQKILIFDYAKSIHMQHCSYIFQNMLISYHPLFINVHLGVFEKMTFRFFKCSRICTYCLSSIYDPRCIIWFIKIIQLSNPVNKKSVLCRNHMISHKKI